MNDSGSNYSLVQCRFSISFRESIRPLGITIRTRWMSFFQKSLPCKWNTLFTMRSTHTERIYNPTSGYSLVRCGFSTWFRVFRSLSSPFLNQVPVLLSKIIPTANERLSSWCGQPTMDEWITPSRTYSFIHGGLSGRCRKCFIRVAVIIGTTPARFFE